MEGSWSHVFDALTYKEMATLLQEGTEDGGWTAKDQKNLTARFKRRFKPNSEEIIAFLARKSSRHQQNQDDCVASVEEQGEAIDPLMVAKGDDETETSAVWSPEAEFFTPRVKEDQQHAACETSPSYQPYSAPPVTCRDLSQGTAESVEKWEASLRISMEEKRLILQILVPDDQAVAPHGYWIGAAENEVCDAFASRFFGKLCAEDIDKIVSQPTYNPPPGLLKVRALAAEESRHLREEAKAMQARIRDASAQSRKAVGAENKLRKGREGPAEAIADQVYAMLKEKTSLCHDGYSTYAEPRFSGVKELVDWFRDQSTDLTSEVIMDLGSGVGTVLWTMSQLFGCKAIGVEYAPNRVFQSANVATSILAKFSQETHFRANVSMVLGNILDLTRIHPSVTILYLFDEAFPPELMVHIADLVEQSSSRLRYVITAKMAKFACYKGFFQDKGFLDTGKKIATSKIGSGEGSTFSIWKRAKDNTTSTPPDFAGSYTEMIEQKIDYYWEAERETKVTFYRELERAAEAIMSMARGQKGAATRDRNCTPELTLEYCKEVTCEECQRYFRHEDIRSLFASPVDWLAGELGLFTGKALCAGQFIIQYRGVKTENTAGPYVLEVSPHEFINTKNRGLQQYVNHSCNPNCSFLKWVDKKGATQVSIVAKKDIPLNSELTVDYGGGRTKFECRCPSCQPAPKGNILLFGMTEASAEWVRTYLKTGALPSLTELQASKPKGNGTQLHRDFIRLQALRAHGWRPHTVSLQTNDVSSWHVVANWNSPKFVAKFVERGVVFSRVEMDWYWMPWHYLNAHLEDTFFTEMLPALADILSDGGVVLLPCQTDLLNRVAKTEGLWGGRYKLSLQGGKAAKTSSALKGAEELLLAHWADEDWYALTQKNRDTQQQYTGLAREATALEAEARRIYNGYKVSSPEEPVLVVFSKLPADRLSGVNKQLQTEAAKVSGEKKKLQAEVDKVQGESKTLSGEKEKLQAEVDRLSGVDKKLKRKSKQQGKGANDQKRARATTTYDSVAASKEKLWKEAAWRQVWLNQKMANDAGFKSKYWLSFKTNEHPLNIDSDNKAPWESKFEQFYIKNDVTGPLLRSFREMLALEVVPDNKGKHRLLDSIIGDAPERERFLKGLEPNNPHFTTSDIKLGLVRVIHTDRFPEKKEENFLIHYIFRRSMQLLAYKPFPNENYYRKDLWQALRQYKNTIQTLDADEFVADKMASGEEPPIAFYDLTQGCHFFDLTAELSSDDETSDDALPSPASDDWWVPQADDHEEDDDVLASQDDSKKEDGAGGDGNRSNSGDIPGQQGGGHPFGPPIYQPIFATVGPIPILPSTSLPHTPTPQMLIPQEQQSRFPLGPGRGRPKKVENLTPLSKLTLKELRQLPPHHVAEHFKMMGKRPGCHDDNLKAVEAFIRKRNQSRHENRSDLGG